MAKEDEKEDGKEPVIFEDSIIAGILLALDHRVVPFRKPDSKIIFKVYGDVEASINKVYSNCPVGLLDVMRSIKLTRSMIFNMRGQK